MVNRVSTGIKELDRMLQGGLLPRSAVLVRGAPGIGKTTLGLQFLIHSATVEDEPGLLVTFEEFPESIYRDAQNLGWDLRDLERQGQVSTYFTSPDVLRVSLESPDSPLSQIIRQRGITRLVLDSMTHFGKLADDPESLRRLYGGVINALKREGITSLLLSETPNAPALLRAEMDHLFYVVDGVILLCYVETDSAMLRALAILKMRGTGHGKEIRRFEIAPGGIRLLAPFQDHEAILTGSPRLRQQRHT